MKFPLFPDEASGLARQTDYLYWALICLSAVVMLVVFVPMIFFLFKYFLSFTFCFVSLLLPSSSRFSSFSVESTSFYSFHDHLHHHLDHLQYCHQRTTEIDRQECIAILDVSSYLSLSSLNLRGPM